MGHVAVNAEILSLKLFHQILKGGEARADHLHDIINPATGRDTVNDLVPTVDESLKPFEIGFAMTAERYCYNHLGEISQLAERDIGVIAPNISSGFQSRQPSPAGGRRQATNLS